MTRERSVCICRNTVLPINHLITSLLSYGTLPTCAGDITRPNAAWLPSHVTSHSWRLLCTLMCSMAGSSQFAMHCLAHSQSLLCLLLLSQGPIPAQFRALSHLQSLNLSSNELTGSLPTFIGQLQTASGVWLDHNQLSGSIPNAWCTNASVTSAVYIDYNSGLYGAVPQCLQGRLQQGNGYAGTGLSEAVGSSSPGQAASSSSSASSGSTDASSVGDASSSGSSIANNSTSGGSTIGSQGTGNEAPMCSSSSCGLVLLAPCTWLM